MNVDSLLIASAGYGPCLLSTLPLTSCPWRRETVSALALVVLTQTIWGTSSPLSSA